MRRYRTCSPSALRFDGRTIRKIAPTESPGDAQMRPPWAVMIEREIDNPMPIPPPLVVNIESKMRSPAPASKPPRPQRNRPAQFCFFADSAESPEAVSFIRNRTVSPGNAGDMIEAQP
jgi:hypothetical protein